MRICPQCRQRTEERVCPDDAFQTIDEELLAGTRDPRLGTVFEERYRIDAVLGRGGMGTVYRATQLTVGRPVAIKVLNADLVSDLTTLARFQQEARSVAALSHPNTIRLIDFGHAEDGTLFLVMEYLEGEPLSSLITREAPLDAARVIRVGRQVLESLAEAHNVGIVHRDLKPDNLFVTELFGRTDFVKILDFGIAKVTGFGQDTSLTGAGVALGSPRYISPEQASAGPVDARADIYAVGVVLYELLTGAPPFVCGSVAEYMMAHVERDVPRLRVGDRELTGRLPDLILRCLAKSPMHRPRSATELLGLLEECIDRPFEEVPPIRHDDLPRTQMEASSADASGWPGAPSRDGSLAGPSEQPTGGPRASQTGLAARGHHAVPSAAHAPSTSKAAPVALAALLLMGLSGGGVWWLTQPADTPAAAQNKASAPLEEVEAAPSEAATEVPAESSQPAEAIEASPTGDTLMLVTVPEGATVKRGDIVLGTTPFALVWGSERDMRPLDVKLEGYQRELLRYSDVGSAARYELYLRPQDATPTRRPKRRSTSAAEGSWVEKISKPTKAGRARKPTKAGRARKPAKAAKPASGTKPKPAPAAPKKRVYEEL